jgi:hypothetical protein
MRDTYDSVTWSCPVHGAITQSPSAARLIRTPRRWIIGLRCPLDEATRAEGLHPFEVLRLWRSGVPIVDARLDVEAGDPARLWPRGQSLTEALRQLEGVDAADIVANAVTGS